MAIKSAPIAAAAGPDVEDVVALGGAWHGAGSVSDDVLRRLAAHLKGLGPDSTVETGAGRSTIIFSWYSKSHTTFSNDSGNSVSLPLASPLLRREAVTWIQGPTQRTLPDHRFSTALDVVLLDGPHAFPFPQLEYYYLYPHIRPGGLLIVDDIQIRSIRDLFRWLRADAMWHLLEVVDTTAFFRRTDAPTFDPFGDGWWLQRYNQHGSIYRLIGSVTPGPAKRLWRRLQP